MATRPPTNGASPSPRSPAPAKVVPSVVKHEDTGANPSLDFLKWLTDSLKGLNQSVNRTQPVFDVFNVTLISLFFSRGYHVYASDLPVGPGSDHC